MSDARRRGLVLYINDDFGTKNMNILNLQFCLSAERGLSERSEENKFVSSFQIGI